MAQPHETGNPIVTSDNSILAILAGPLGSNWTVEVLAEQVLNAIATQEVEGGYEFVLDAATTTDRQVQRLIRPFLACLATRSAAEGDTPVNLYSGPICFKR